MTLFKDPIDNTDKVLLSFFFGLILLFVWVFTTMGQERLKDYDLVRKDYFRVVVNGDTLEDERFQNLYTAEQFLRGYADTVKVDPSSSYILGMNFWFRPDYEPIPEGTLQSLLLKDVNWQHSQDPDSAVYDIRVEAYSIADSVQFHYTGFDSTGLVLDVKNIQIPHDRTVRDTLTTDFKGIIQLEIEAYYETSYTEDSLTLDMGFISSLGIKKKDSTMSQYWTDFREYTTGEQPTGWTQRGDEYDYLVRDRAGVTGGKVLEINNNDDTTDGVFAFLTWDILDSDPNRGNAEVQVRFRFPNSIANPKSFIGTRVTESGGVINNCYHFQMQEGNNRQAIGMINNGTYSVFDGNFGEIDGGVQTDTWYRARFRVNGTTIQSRVWVDGEPEPASWEFTETNGDVTAVGFVGIGEYSDVTLIEYDWMGVGTNGDSAPSTDPGGGGTSISGTSTTTTASAAGADSQKMLSGQSLNEAASQANILQQSSVAAASITAASGDALLSMLSALAGSSLTQSQSDALAGSLKSLSGQSVTDSTGSALLEVLGNVVSISGTSTTQASSQASMVLQVAVGGQSLNEASSQASAKVSIAVRGDSITIVGGDAALKMAAALSGESITTSTGGAVLVKKGQLFLGTIALADQPLYRVELQAKPFYDITLHEQELYTITLEIE